MKKIIVALIGLILIAVVGLFFAGQETRVVTTEVEITAPPEAVWNVIADIDSWKDWSPIIKDSSGEASKGARLIITMISEEGKSGKSGPRYEPVVTVFEPGQNLTWTANMGANFIFTNGKILLLEPTDVGTRFTHKETFQGLMAPLMWGKVQENVPGMLDSMNMALKELVEAGNIPQADEEYSEFE